MARHQPPRRARRGPAPSPAPDQERRGLRVPWRVGLLVALVAAAGFVLASRPSRQEPTAATTAGAATPVASHASGPHATGIPRLVDVGADRCIPCKAMAPILASLRTEYAGRMQVDFIDVWKDPSAGEPYRIYSIPTQIFYDEHGRELTRHQGFLSKEDILATWKRVGYDFTAAAPAGPAS